MKIHQFIRPLLLPCLFMILVPNLFAAQEETPPPTSTGNDQSNRVIEGPKTPEEVILGDANYQTDSRRIGTPQDIERDLDFSFPKRDYVLPRVISKKWFKWKEDLYKDFGVKLGLSYQAIYQHASDTTPNGDDNVGAGWLLVEGKWEVFNRGKDFEGSLVAAFDWRHTYGDGNDPVAWGPKDLGSLWFTEGTFVEWDPWLPVAFWEQWFTKDRFVLRMGQQLVGQIYDFFRFKDPRVAFTNSLFTFPAVSQPIPGPGLAASFELWPIANSTLYVVGTINDLNFEPEKWTWGNAVSEADFFYGLEVGYNWVRAPGDFDHLHINLFYSGKPEENPIPALPSDNGWGIKILGEKQISRFVGFGSYTYNTSKGGPFGLTLADHSATVGLAHLKPFGLRGEIGLGGTWAHPENDNLDSQYGLDVYWKVLVLPSLWITPGVQFIFEPTFNPNDDVITIGQIKARLFF